MAISSLLPCQQNSQRPLGVGSTSLSGAFAKPVIGFLRRHGAQSAGDGFDAVHAGQGLNGQKEQAQAQASFLVQTEGLAAVAGKVGHLVAARVSNIVKQPLNVNLLTFDDIAA